MRVGVDVGGTFTDLVAIGPRGLVVSKVPSTPEAPERAIWDAYTAAGLRAAPEALIHGTTVATNALLERKGARVVLVVTAGFEDLLELRRQDRAALYDLTRHHPPPLVPRERVVGVAERMGPAGPLVALDERAIAAVVESVRALEPEAIGVSLLFGFRHPEHEQRLAGALRAAFPEVPVVIASDLVPRVREYERTSTVAAEAFLRPRVGAYLARFASDATERGIPAPRVLASNGGALPAALAAERAVWLALSGPAGGIQGAAMVGAASGIPDLLTLDMGGTSADAGVVVNGEATQAAHGTVAGLALSVPHIAIETVSAGGGSIGWIDSGGALRAGPESAGADPGPACYGRGGTRPTITDAFAVLGWIGDGSLLGGSVRINRQLAVTAISGLAAQAGLDPEACALGMIRVAEATMARALRRVSVERGFDPANLTLLAFGGAGPLCACSLAELVGVRRVLLPPHAGVLSALGMAAAADMSERSAAVHGDVAGFAELAPRLAEELKRRLETDLPGSPVRFVAECRYRGQGYELDVPCDPDAWSQIAESFHEAHQRTFGYRDMVSDVEVIELRGVARSEPASKRVGWSQGDRAGAVSRMHIRLAAGQVDAAGYDWDALRAGQVLAGPAIIEGRSATALLPPGWSARVNEIGAIIADVSDARPR